MGVSLLIAPLRKKGLVARRGKIQTFSYWPLGCVRWPNESNRRLPPHADLINMSDMFYGLTWIRLAALKRLQRGFSVWICVCVCVCRCYKSIQYACQGNVPHWHTSRTQCFEVKRCFGFCKALTFAAYCSNEITENRVEVGNGIPHMYMISRRTRRTTEEPKWETCVLEIWCYLKEPGSCSCISKTHCTVVETLPGKEGKLKCFFLRCCSNSLLKGNQGLFDVFLVVW